jgi:signal transduction histidine kinase
MRRRLLVYLVLAVAPLAVLALYLALDEQRDAEERSRLEQKAIVKIVRTDLDRLFRLGRGVVSALSYKKTDEEICGSLASLSRAFPEFFNLGMFEIASGDAKASVVCGVRMSAGAQFKLTSEERAIVDTLQAPGDIRVASVRRNIVDGRPVIPVGALVRAAPDGRRWFVSASISLEWLSEEVNRTSIPPGAVLLVLDRNGMVAARNPPSQEFAPGKPAPAFERTLPGRGDFDSEVLGEGGVTRYYTLNRVGEADGLVVVLKMRSSDIFRSSRQRLIVQLLGLLVVSGIVFCVAWVRSGRYIARPLARLSAVSERLAAGNLAERTGLPYSGEIGQLARSFDLMAASLQREESRGAEMLDSLRALAARLESVSDEERTRIAREVHDELGQQLTAMQFELDRLARRLGDAPEAHHVRCLTAMTDTAIHEVRKIATELRPVALDYGGLQGAIEWLTEDFERRTGVRCSLSILNSMDVSDEPATCLFRICQESLTNIARHSGATKAEISLAREDGWLTLTVRDNGRGLDRQEGRRRSLGVLGMGERARIAGGSCEIGNHPEGGVCVRARIPDAQGRARLAARA